MQGLKTCIDQFSFIDDRAYKEVQNCFSERQLIKHDFFTQEGQIGKEIGFLKEGIVRAYHRDFDGKEFTKQFFVAPCIIGAYSSLLTSEPSVIIQQALTNCSVAVAQYKDIIDLYDKHHSLERLGRKIAEHYYLEKEKKLIEQAVFDAEKRYVIFKERFPDLESLIPQYHIASYVGVTPTQLSRIRKKRGYL